VQDLQSAVNQLDGKMDEVGVAARSINEKLREVSNKADQLEKKRKSFTPSPLPPPSVPNIAPLVNRTLRLKAQQDEAIPLLLRSVESDQARRGRRAIRRPTVEAIPADDGLFCINGTRAIFTFWNQYPVWGQVFSISNLSGALQVKLSLLLEGRCTWESDLLNAMAPVVFRTGDPIRFRKARLLVLGAKGATRLCIANPDVYAAARIA
jgi:hypothetical protein